MSKIPVQTHPWNQDWVEFLPGFFCRQADEKLPSSNRASHTNLQHTNATMGNVQKESKTPQTSVTISIQGR